MFHSASQRPGQSITDFVRELQSLAGTCEFRNEQLEDSLRGRFISFRSKLNGRYCRQISHLRRQLILQLPEKSAKNVPDFKSNSQSESPSESVNKVKSDNLSSRNHT